YAPLFRSPGDRRAAGAARRRQHGAAGGVRGRRLGRARRPPGRRGADLGRGGRAGGGGPRRGRRAIGRRGGETCRAWLTGPARRAGASPSRRCSSPSAPASSGWPTASPAPGSTPRTSSRTSGSGSAGPATSTARRAWLTTVVARLAFDHLRSAHRRRESYVVTRLPEPIVTGRPEGTVAAGTGRPGASAGAATGAAPDPGELAELADSLTFGFLRVLEALSPVERLVFVLADVFGTPFSEIA